MYFLSKIYHFYFYIFGDTGICNWVSAIYWWYNIIQRVDLGHFWSGVIMDWCDLSKSSIKMYSLCNQKNFIFLIFLYIDNNDLWRDIFKGVGFCGFHIIHNMFNLKIIITVTDKRIFNRNSLDLHSTASIVWPVIFHPESLIYMSNTSNNGLSLLDSIDSYWFIFQGDFGINWSLGSYILWLPNSPTGVFTFSGDPVNQQ